MAKYPDCLCHVYPKNSGRLCTACHIRKEPCTCVEGYFCHACYMRKKSVCNDPGMCVQNNPFADYPEKLKP